MRIALLVCLPLAGLLGIVSSHWNWSVGAIYAGFALIALPAMLIVLRGVPKRPRR